MGKKYYECYYNATPSEKIDQAIAEQIDVIQTIFQEMEDDPDDESERLLLLYKMVSPDERAIMDYLLTHICGWTLGSIIELARERGLWYED